MKSDGDSHTTNDRKSGGMSERRQQRMRLEISREAARLFWEHGVAATSGEQFEKVCAHLYQGADRILPLEFTAARLPKLIKNSQLVVITGGQHAINWTHADQVNPVLLNFLQQE